jgi:hypothetical protein
MKVTSRKRNEQKTSEKLAKDHKGYGSTATCLLGVIGYR